MRRQSSSREIGWLIGWLENITDCEVEELNPEYIHTFFATKTGFQYTIDSFRNGNNDLAKSDIFTVQKRHWTSIRNEVKAWTTSNWSAWEATAPDWFTENFVASVPDDFIPKQVDPQRRRTSLGDLWRGAGGERGTKRGGGGGRPRRVEPDPNSGA